MSTQINNNEDNGDGISVNAVLLDTLALEFDLSSLNKLIM